MHAEHGAFGCFLDLDLDLDFATYPVNGIKVVPHGQSRRNTIRTYATSLVRLSGPTPQSKYFHQKGIRKTICLKPKRLLSQRKKCLNQKICHWTSKLKSNRRKKWIQILRTLKQKPLSRVPAFRFWRLIIDDGRINININSKTDGLKQFLPSEEEAEPEKLKLDEAFFPDRDQTNYRNPPEMNIVIQIIGSRGSILQR